MPRLKPQAGAKPALKSKPPPSEGRRFGYARVSTYGQALDAQLEQLKAEGCSKIAREKASGARPDRRELLRMLKNLAPGVRRPAAAKARSQALGPTACELAG